MPVFKIHKTNDFTCIPNSLLRDNNLSNQAIGLICKMLSLPPEWNYSIKGLVSICKDGQCKITSALQELKDNGYLKIVPIRQDGKIIKWEYHIYEEKQQINNTESFNIEETSAEIEEEISEVEKNIEKPTLNNNVITEKSRSDYRKEKKSKNQVIESDAENIISYLNMIADTNFRMTNNNLKLVKQLLRVGFTIDEIKKVIDFKTKEWINDSRMRQYIRPQTLFGEKFEAYLNASNINITKYTYNTASASRPIQATQEYQNRQNMSHGKVFL